MKVSNDEELIDTERLSSENQKFLPQVKVERAKSIWPQAAKDKFKELRKDRKIIDPLDYSNQDDLIFDRCQIPQPSYQERARALCMKFCKRDIKIKHTGYVKRVYHFQENTMFDHNQEGGAQDATIQIPRAKLVPPQAHLHS